MGLGRALGELGDPEAALSRGTCVSLDWTTGLVEVNLGGGIKRMPMVGTGPMVGDQVWVASLAGQPVCLGSLPKSALGTIIAEPVGGKVQVRGDDQVVSTLPFNYDHEPFGVNQRVAIDWQSGTVEYRLSSDATIMPPAAPAPPAAATEGPKTVEFSPVDSGSFWQSGGSWAKADVWCTDSYLGAYFYAGIADTIPDTAQITAVRLSVVETENRFPSSRATFGTHNLGGKSGAPVISNAVAVPAGSGTWPLPTSIGDALKTGAARGIGTNHGGYHRFGTAASGSGRLFITYA
jgi:hypothetical protein